MKDLDRIRTAMERIDASRGHDAISRAHGELRDLLFDLGEAHDLLSSHHAQLAEFGDDDGTPYPWEDHPRTLGIYGNRSAT